MASDELRVRIEKFREVIERARDGDRDAILNLCQVNQGFAKNVAGYGQVRLAETIIALMEEDEQFDQFCV